MSVEGVDYSLDRADPACLYRSGVRFVCRYTSRTAAKNITAAEAKALAAAGLWIVTVFETSADFMLQGRDRGVIAARESLAITNACGMPADRPHLFAYDVDPNNMSSTTKATLAAFCDGAASVLGRNQVGVYGGYALIEALCPTYAPWGWQTYAWSGGRWSAKAQIQQYQNNVPLCGAASLDRNRATTADFGQWQPGKSPTGGLDVFDDSTKKWLQDTFAPALAKAVADAVRHVLADQEVARQLFVNGLHAAVLGRTGPAAAVALQSAYQMLGAHGGLLAQLVAGEASDLTPEDVEAAVRAAVADQYEQPAEQPQAQPEQQA